MDAQSSANGGIIIQVIGEMSNRGEPWRKFVQTFFLAEQPNGYFVLNDIFRFLKEEAVESDDSDVEVPAPAPESPVRAAAPVPELAPAPSLAPSESNESTSATGSPVVASVAVSVEDSAPPSELDVEDPASLQLNGHAQADTKELEPASDTGALVSETTRSPTPTTPAVESPAPPIPPVLPVATSPATSAPSAQPLAAPPPVVAHQPLQPTSAPAPAAPKTWANLAAANSKKWGSAVAQESRGTSEVPTASSSSPVGNGPQTPAAHHGPPGRPHVQRDQREPHPAYIAAQSVPTALCFVKVCCHIH